MSIRLRLTLIYTLILALLLVIISIVLFFSQDQTMNKSDQIFLKSVAGRVVEGWPVSLDSAPRSPSKSDRHRETYIQTRRPDGELLQPDPSLDGLVLPLSEAGRQTLQQGENWFETAEINNEEFLIYNQLLVDVDEPTILQVAVSLAYRNRFLGNLRNILITGSIVIVGLVFGVSWVLAGLALRPIHRITQTARTIGAKRDFNRRVDYTGPTDEIGQLAITFNTMVAELQAAYLQVEETLQTQRRFVADASHELRTPLTTLRGNIGLLQREPPIRPEDRTDVLTDMVEETERLMRLVHDLLVLARADAGRPLQQEPVNLKPLLEDVCQQIKLLSPRRSIICRSPLEVTVVGDGDALRQVILALLDNALKHTPVEAAVTLDSATQDGQVTIRVSDNGPGIAPEHLPHIFDRFYRGDTARSSPGTGLGLAIAHELTCAQQGTLKVESRVGQGSSFTLTFPRYSGNARP